MRDQNDQRLIPSQGGVFQDLALRVKLILQTPQGSPCKPLA